MKTKIGTKSFAEFREHKLARARKLDRKEHIPSEKRITFATPDEMLSHITPKRVRLNPAGVRLLTEPIKNWTGAPRSPQRTWAENDMFRLLLAD
jgi:hypothetical protein